MLCFCCVSLVVGFPEPLGFGGWFGVLGRGFLAGLGYVLGVAGIGFLMCWIRVLLWFSGFPSTHRFGVSGGFPDVCGSGVWVLWVLLCCSAVFGF